MIDPTDADLGRSVVYQASYPDAPREEGVIVGFNDEWVFVRYCNQHPTAAGKATSRQDLNWAFRSVRRPYPTPPGRP